MTLLNHITLGAAILLLIELIVLLIVLAGISGGLAFGLHWVKGKAPWAFDKVNGYVSIGTKYAHKGLSMSAKPFSTTASITETVRTALLALKREVEMARNSRREPVHTQVTVSEATMEVPTISQSSTQVGDVGVTTRVASRPLESAAAE